MVGIHKKHCLRFKSIQEDFFYFLFSIYKLVDIMDVYKFYNITIGTVMKNPEK